MQIIIGNTMKKDCLSLLLHVIASFENEAKSFIDNATAAAVKLYLTVMFIYFFFEVLHHYLSFGMILICSKLCKNVLTSDYSLGKMIFISINFVIVFRRYIM